MFSPHSPVAFQTLDDRGRFHGRVEFISVRDKPAWPVLLAGIAGVVTVGAGVFQRLGADLHAGDASKVLHPFLDQDGELPGFLFGRPGVQGCLLREGDQLLLGGPVTVPVDELPGQFIQHRLDAFAAGGGGVDGGDVDAGDLDHRPVPGNFALAQAQAQACADLLHDQPVVPLGCGDVELVQVTGVKAGPFAVNAQDLVRHHHVIVQLGIPGAGIVVPELRVNQSSVHVLLVTRSDVLVNLNGISRFLCPRNVCIGCRHLPSRHSTTICKACFSSSARVKHDQILYTSGIQAGTHACRRKGDRPPVVMWSCARTRC